MKSHFGLPPLSSEHWPFHTLIAARVHFAAGRNIVAIENLQDFSFYRGNPGKSASRWLLDRDSMA
jgi:hypothetical protein